MPHREITIDTSTLPPHAVRRFVQESLAAFVRAEIDIKDTSKLRARWRISQCGNSTMMRVVSDGDSPSGLRRTAAHLAQESDLYCQIFRVQQGTLEIRQMGRSLVLDASQFAVLATHSPFESRRGAVGPTDVYSVRIPLRLLSNRLRNPEDYALRPMPIRAGVESITLDFMKTLAEKMQGVSSAVWPVLANQLADLLSLTLLGVKDHLPSSESAVRLATLDRIKAFINERLGQLELSPSAIAAANGLSLRYLHRLFQESGHTVGDYLRSQRLASARRALENPSRAGTSVGEIAFSNGFRSAAHFSKTYAEEFGEPPRVTRARSSQHREADRSRKREQRSEKQLLESLSPKAINRETDQ